MRPGRRPNGCAQLHRRRDSPRPELRGRPDSLSHTAEPARERDRRPAHRRCRAGAPRARGRHGLRGRRVRGAGRGRRRPRRQHEPDRLPGGLHRPVLRRPGRRHDLPADRQPRTPLRRRPVGAAVAPRAHRRERDRGRAGRRPPARATPARPRDPGDRRGGHPGAGPAPSRERQPARDAPGTGIARPGGGRGARRGRAALGGPGLRRRGLAGGRDGHRGGRGRPARRDRRLRPEGEHRSKPSAPRRPGPRPAPHGRRPRTSSRATSRASSCRPVRAIRRGSPGLSRWRVR